MPRLAPALLALSSMLAATAALAQSSADWSLKIRQDGTSFETNAAVTLKRAPFEFVFQGPVNRAYAVVATTHCSEVAGVKTAEQMSELVNPGNVVAEGAERNSRHLVLNRAGTIKARDDNSTQVWLEDKDNEMYSFQSYTPTPDGHVTAVREIRETVLLPAPPKAKARAVPIQNTKLTLACVLVSALPPADHMSPSAPLLLRLNFVD